MVEGSKVLGSTVLGSIVVLAMTAAAQTPARDRVAADKGTSVISGMVIDAETRKPLRRASVYVNVPNQTRSTRTDAEGQFVLSELPAGKFILNATKVGYLAATGPLSANPRQRVTPLEVGNGQTVAKVVIALSRGGVISGRVLDESGDPLDGAQVRAMRYAYAEGQRRLVHPGGVMIHTDDLGAFRLYGLQPGDYYVLAQAGREFSPFAAPNAEGPAPTFFPGTANPAEAKAVAVRAGHETSGIVFPVSVMRMSRIRGRVYSQTVEQFMGWSLAVFPGDPHAAGSYGFGFGGGVRPDGTFEYGNLPPGTYGFEARPQGYPPQPDGEVARAIVTVGGEDINDVVLSATRAGRARGRMVMDDGTPLPFPAASIRLTAQPVDLKTPFRNGAPGIVGKDGTFEVHALIGHMRLQDDSIYAAAPTASWMFKAVRHGGRDVTDAGIEFRPGETVEGIDVVYTRKVTRVTGTLDPRVNPAATWILVFAADESKWTIPARYVRGLRAGADGAYSVALVPNQEYLIAAVDDIEDYQWTDHEVLRAIGNRATRLTLPEGETRTHDLKILEWRR